MIVDYEHDNFSVSQTSWDHTGQSNIVAIKTIWENQINPSHKLSGGAIAGIVIGAIAGVAILVLLGWFLLKKRRDHQKPEEETKDAVAELDVGADPFKVIEARKESGHPYSPELDSSPHKGHELDTSESPSGPHSPMTETTYFELDTGTRHSQLISPISDRSGMHGRQLSDPSSVGSGKSESSANTGPGFVDPISPMRERSDARRKRLQRGISDTVSNDGIQEKEEPKEMSDSN